MPKIYRSMKQAEDGKPVVEASAKGLGVRVTGPHQDVDLDDQGNVVLNGRGMSAAPAWRTMLPHLIPRRLKPECPRAAGPPSLYCFAMGEGTFADGPVADSLELRVDSQNHDHGVVAPSQLVPLDRYQSDLASTRDSWSVDER